MDKYFKGYYYKHQKDENSLSFIVGESSDEKFVQIITKNNSYNIPFNDCGTFSDSGVQVNIKHKDISLFGKVKYTHLTPLKYDIMGPFKFIPLECKHKIVSMKHKIDGSFTLNGEFMDFDGGTGYIEGDYGVSFPKSYLWIQCGNFHENYSIVASVANIPLGLFSFNGCICNINYLGKEYRLATYLGVKIICVEKDKLILRQRKYKLVVHIYSKNTQKLSAPKEGKMSDIIYEDISATANFKFYVNGIELFNITNKFASFEYVIQK